MIHDAVFKKATKGLRLTKGQSGVLRLVWLGQTNAAIAETLGIGLKGVERHVQKLRGMLVPPLVTGNPRVALVNAVWERGIQ